MRPLGEPWQAGRQAPGSQLRVFEETLALLTGSAAAAPVLLVLEDLHWADTSTLDLVVFLAHNLGDQPVLLLATCRADEPSSAGRMRRLADGVRRSGSALMLELGPLGARRADGAAHGPRRFPARGNGRARSPPAPRATPSSPKSFSPRRAGRASELPEALRDLLLQRVARLDHPTQGVLRLAAAAGREVGYPLLRATAELPDGALRDSLRAAVEGGVLAAEPQTGSFRFRHALLAEAIYATILPGEREELHARLAEELARSGAAGAAELAPHWAAAGRAAEALAASVEAARQAEAVFGLAEAHAHLERALTLWPPCRTRPSLPRSTSPDSAPGQPSSPAASVPPARGRARPASDRSGRRGRPAPCSAPPRSVSVEYLYESGSQRSARRARARGRARAGGAASPERAYALGALAGGLMVAWRYARVVPISEQALALARRVGAHARQRSGHSPCWASISPTSAAPRRASPISSGPATRRGDR